MKKVHKLKIPRPFVTCNLQELKQNPPIHLTEGALNLTIITVLASFALMTEFRNIGTACANKVRSFRQGHIFSPVYTTKLTHKKKCSNTFANMI